MERPSQLTGADVVRADVAESSGAACAYRPPGRGGSALVVARALTSGDRPVAGVEGWLAGEYVPFATARAQVDELAESRLVLTPE